MTIVPIRSMTGYGEAEREIPSGRLRVEVRTVNHRHLNVQMRVPTGLERFQTGLERALKESFARGHVRVTFGLAMDAAARPPVTISVDLERARGYVNALRTLREELDLEGRIDMGTLAWLPNLFRETEAEEPSPGPEEVVLEEVLRDAVDQVLESRETEGMRLADDLSERVNEMERIVLAIDARAPQRLVEERDRLREAIRELLDDSIPVDRERIAREVAHLAERWDIHEELVRLRAHLDMFRETLGKGSETGVGKRLGFIAQEVLREINTIGSKANDAVISARVLELKEEVERVREQVENVE